MPSKKTVFLPLFFLLFLAGGSSFSQSYNQGFNDKTFYGGIGSKLSSYIGGDFGSIFAIRYSADENYNADDEYYYNKGNDYAQSGPSYSLNPLQVNLFGGVNLNNNFSMELESSLIWHTRGNVDADYVTGVENGFSYVDKNSNSSMLALPIMASLKFFPLGKDDSPFYLTGGYGIQFISESAERVRDYYYNTGYYGNTSYFSIPIEEYSTSSWLTGFKVGAGISYNMFGNLLGEIELSFTNFINNNADYNTPLALDRTTDIGNISLGTKILFGF